LRSLKDRAEVFSNPEYWWVENGIVERSFSGAPVEGFIHAAVFCPVPVDESRLVLVVEDEFKGQSRGEYVERMYYKLVGSSYTGWGYTDDSLLVHNGPAVVRALEASLDKPMDFQLVLHQGPPGCGKTSAIVKAADEGDVFLVPVRKAARELAERLVAHNHRFKSVVGTRVRTTDSYLVNCLSHKQVKKLTAVRLMADEAFMTRAGRWYAAAAMLGVSEVHAYGDVKQIPHVPRAECPKLHLRVVPQAEYHTWLSYRCPPELVACWGSQYDWRVRSTSRVKGVVKQVATVKGMAVPSGCVMMGMYQADKLAIGKLYRGCGVKILIMTVHESEGNTYAHVRLHRFDLRKRTDSFSLYDKEPYALVAMSRSTESFTYVSPDLGDLVSTWIKRGQDPRRVAAAADTESAGVSKEFT